VIGEVDFSSALTTLHEKAIYIQDGQQYHVERLDYDDRKAYVHQVSSEYFTDAISYTKIKVLERFETATLGPASKNHGEVQVNTQVVGFKKIKFHTMENVGAGELTLPEQEMHTTAFWLTLPHELMASLPYGSTERLDGVNGLANALEAIATLLVMCDARDLGRAVGENEESRTQKAEGRKQKAEEDSGFGIQGEEEDHPSLAGDEDESKIQNLKSIIARPASRNQSPQPGLESGIRNLKSEIVFEPNIYLYDKYPGGVGLSEPLFRLCDSLLEKTLRLISGCPCPNGCPSCVGPVGEVGEKGKEVALEILRRLSVVRSP
jgi:DEAD/DEAH box helicase domain-containing protein